MSKISINLLPEQLRDETIADSRRMLLTKISISFLILMLILSSAVLGFRFFQNSQKLRLNEQIKIISEKINSLKQSEELSLVLRERLSSINLISSQETPQAQAFNLISTLTPQQVSIINFSADRSGKVSLDGKTNQLSALKILFDNLTDPKKHEGRIFSSRVESLSSQGDEIRFALVVSLK